MLRLLLAPAVAQAQHQAGRAALLASSTSSSGVLQQLGFSTAAAPGTPPAAPPQPTITAPTALGRKPQDWSLAMHKAAEISAQSVTKASDKEIGYCTGIPTETYNRMARIYSPARTASQSGLARTNHNSAPAPAWKIAFETTGKWENPLIGWTSTADPLENVGRASLFFYTKEQAIDFCKKHGWNFAVEDPNPRRTDRQKRYAAYGDNFSVKRKGLPDLSHLPSNKKK